MPVSKKNEVFVEHFDAQGISQANKTFSTSPSNTINIADNWVIISSKKRVRSFHTSDNPRSSNLLKVKQGLDLKIWKVDRKPTNQEEALLNLN